MELKVVPDSKTSTLRCTNIERAVTIIVRKYMQSINPLKRKLETRGQPVFGRVSTVNIVKEEPDLYDIILPGSSQHTPGLTAG